jgi:O-antigen ligase
MSQQKKNVYRLLGSLYASFVVVSCVAIAYWIFGSVTYDSRVQAFFESPNQLSLFLAPGLSVAGALYYALGSAKTQASVGRIFVIVGAISIVCALLLTKTWTVWGAVLGALVISFFVFFPRYRTYILIGGIIAGLLLGLALWNSDKMEVLRFQSERSSLASRVMIWRSSQLMLSHHPIVGIGPGAFQQKYLDYQEYFPPYLEWAVAHPHNLFLATWLFSGVLGLVGFFGLILWWFVRLYACVASRKDFIQQKYVVVSLWSAMVTILLYGLFDTPFWKNDLAIVFWTVFVAGVVVSNWRNKKLSRRLMERDALVEAQPKHASGVLTSINQSRRVSRHTDSQKRMRLP